MVPSIFTVSCATDSRAVFHIDSTFSDHQLDQPVEFGDCIARIAIPENRTREPIGNFVQIVFGTLNRELLFVEGEPNQDMGEPLQVFLSSTDRTLLSVPNSVTIPADQMTQSFQLRLYLNRLGTSEETVEISIVETRHDGNDETVVPVMADWKVVSTRKWIIWTVRYIYF